jgi:hypothetical protein
LDRGGYIEDYWEEEDWDEEELDEDLEMRTDR